MSAGIAGLAPLGIPPTWVESWCNLNGVQDQERRQEFWRVVHSVDVHQRKKSAEKMTSSSEESEKDKPEKGE